MSFPSCTPATSGIGSFHPLEVIPYFRRWKPGMVRDLLYTLIWNCLLGLAFWAIGGMFRPQNITLAGLLMSLIMANGVGYTLHGIFLVSARLGLDTWARGFGPVATAAYYTLVSTLGVFFGFAIVALAFQEGALAWMLQPRWIASLAVSSAILSIMIAMIFFAREKHARAEAELQRSPTCAPCKRRSNRISCSTPSPTWRAWWIPIPQLPSACSRASSASCAPPSPARFPHEVDPALAGFELAPMLLQPVVENAIRHGLEPKVEGGEVTFTARREGAQVVIEIADTGVGFASTTRGGVGLANLRDRLKLLYSGGASIQVGENSPSGARVTVRLPA